jgi:hypothetical protein
MGGEAHEPMQQSHTLTRHKDIQDWVLDRNGLPAVSRVSDRFGEVRPRLTIQFGRPVAADRTPNLDDGVSPVSWSAWLAELDRQQLALKVTPETEFEFVARKDLN